MNNIPLFSESNDPGDNLDTDLNKTTRNIPPPWKILVVDDEPSVHDVTSIILKRFKFQERFLDLIHAHSAREARNILKENDDIALLLLDVVMEEDTAGLDLVHFIRESLGNNFVRILLRTGQPGIAPESEVVERYDINQYLEKSELTAQKLSSAIFTGLRSYRDLTKIEQNRKDLKKVLDATSTLFQSNDLEGFVSGLLEQLISVVCSVSKGHYASTVSGFVTACLDEDEEIQSEIVYGCGEYKVKQNEPISEVVSERTFERIKLAISERQSQFFDDESIFIFNNGRGSQGVIYLAQEYDHHEDNKDLIELFSTNISVVYENLNLNKEIEDTQKEMIFTLGTIAEFRSNETAEHVVRVGKYSELLALKAGLSEQEATLIKHAAPLHDVGKISTPDHILNKPGALTKEEMNIMRKHPSVGYEMLKHSSRDILRAAATIAHEHQEKWDGSGYPRNLKETDIHIYGRIVAVADVFDALGSDRCYKKAWSLDKILDFFNDQRGVHFDPDLIDLFIKHLDEFLVIRDLHNSND